MAKFHTCPSCGRQYPGKVRLCTDCGIDLTTGRRIGVDVGVEEVEEDDREEQVGPVRYAWLLFAACVPGLLRPHVLAGALLVGVVGLGLMGVGILFVIGFMTVLAGAMMGGLGLVLCAQAVAWIVTGEYDLLPDALAEFTSAQWNIFLTLLFGPPLAFAIYLWLTTTPAAGAG